MTMPTVPPDDTDPIADDLGAPDASHAPDGGPRAAMYSSVWRVRVVKRLQ